MLSHPTYTIPCCFSPYITCKTFNVPISYKPKDEYRIRSKVEICPKSLTKRICVSHISSLDAVSIAGDGQLDNGSDRKNGNTVSIASSILIPPKSALVRPQLVAPNTIFSKDILQNAVFLIDKPSSWTSHDVCNKLKYRLRRLAVKKVGHSGTLDPMATGLLIVCTGKATKFCDQFQAEDKVYSGTIRLGEETPSYDAESEVSRRLPWEHLTDEDIAQAALKFVGPINQIPPMFSAISMNGKRLYQLAREGIQIERAPRQIHVSSFTFQRAEPGSQDVHFTVSCSKGTYVRSLAADLGTALGTVAHLTELRRVQSGTMSVNDAWDLEVLAQLLEGMAEPREQEVAEDVQEA